MLIYLGWLVLFVFATSLLLNVVLLFRYVWTRPSRTRSLLVNLSVAGFALVYLLFVLEIGFYFFAVQSDSFGFTLAAKRWFTKYWHPINNAGYRDVDHTASELSENDILLVVGDSFVAGHGIKDYNDRFSNILQRELGDDWVVVNMAKSGWHTKDEYNAIASFPYTPQTIVLSYYVNDIDNAARQHGFEAAFPLTNPPSVLRPFVEFSYFFNFMYWRLYRLKTLPHYDQIRKEYLQEIYTNEEVWQTHRDELLDIVTYTRDRGIELIVVVFPNLKDQERSKLITSRVIEVMRAHGVPVIDVAAASRGKDPATLTVNAVDNHPSVWLNREVARLLLKQIGSVHQARDVDT